LYEQIEKASSNKSELILDSRGALNYTNGHIPNTVSLPFSNVLNADYTYKSTDELSEIF
jgi:3-mercaptopyruvate sulfurtransferase SseA